MIWQDYINRNICRDEDRHLKEDLLANAKKQADHIDALVLLHAGQKQPAEVQQEIAMRRRLLAGILAHLDRITLP